MNFDSDVVKRVSDDIKDTSTTLLLSFSLGLSSPVITDSGLQFISLGLQFPAYTSTGLQFISLGLQSPIYTGTGLQSISLGRTGWNDDLGKFERHQGDIINYKY